MTAKEMAEAASGDAVDVETRGATQRAAESAIEALRPFAGAWAVAEARTWSTTVQTVLDCSRGTVATSVGNALRSVDHHTRGRT